MKENNARERIMSKEKCQRIRIAQIQMGVIPISVPGSSKFVLQMKEKALKYS